MTASGPDFPDHDLLRTGSLINPEGYMFLNSSRSEESDTDQNNDSEEESPNVDQDFGQSYWEKGCEEDSQETNSIDAEIYPGSNGVTLREELSPNPFIIADEFCQLDGANDDSDTEDEYDFEFTTPRPHSKRVRIESDAEDDPSIDEEDDLMPSVRQITTSGHNSSDSDEPESVTNEEDEAEDEDGPSFQVEPGKVVSKDGRDHIAIAYSGKSYIFFKSHRAKSSNISRHVDDILTMSQVEKCLTEKPVLCLLLDDGGDWGGRGLQTLFYLGDLWLRLNLDLLIVSRNAPGDSKYNPIER